MRVLPKTKFSRPVRNLLHATHAKAALDRIVIPQDTFEQIAGMVSPRSSLIISDEALSSETGRGTEFVVLVSGEPDLAGAASGRNERSVVSIESRTVGEPIMAIVSLRSQQITVYDANGWILRAPVSSGQAGRETPAGIFSIIEKEAEHYSNLYDDAYMPHMQRLTWSGIALHGGLLPGHPASHGCVRMPYDFAERLFDATRLGMRVIVAPATISAAKLAMAICAGRNEVSL